MTVTSTDIISTLKMSDNSMLVEHLIKAFYTNLPRLKFVIDAGVNKGFHFKSLAELESVVKCIGLEANPLLIDDLKNVLTSNQILLARALVGSDCTQNTVTFKFSKEYHGRGGVKNSHIWEHISPDLEFMEINTPVIPLDEVVNNNLNGRCDFIKMDLEGSELGILLNSEAIFKNNAIIVMENSVHGPNINKISKSDWINYVKSKDYHPIDFNFKEVTENSLFNFNHLMLIPSVKLEEAGLAFKQAVLDVI